MGLFETTIRVGAMNGGVPAFTQEIRALVDTGATYTTLPAAVLERAGVARIGKMQVRLANGTFVEKDFGIAVMEVAGRVAGANVLFGEKDDFALIGATTLELASLAVDPVAQRLIPVSAIQA